MTNRGSVPERPRRNAALGARERRRSSEPLGCWRLATRGKEPRPVLGWHQDCSVRETGHTFASRRRWDARPGRRRKACFLHRGGTARPAAGVPSSESGSCWRSCSPGARRMSRQRLPRRPRLRRRHRKRPTIRRSRSSRSETRRPLAPATRQARAGSGDTLPWSRMNSGPTSPSRTSRSRASTAARSFSRSSPTTTSASTSPAPAWS